MQRAAWLASLENEDNARMIRLLTGCAAMLLAGAAAGQIYECVNAKGQREFAQICPPGTVKETRLMNSGSGAWKPATAPAPAAEQKPSAESPKAETKAEKEKTQPKEAVKGSTGASKPATAPAPAAGQKPPAESPKAEAKAEKEKTQPKEAVKGSTGASKPAAAPAPGPKSLAERDAELRKRMLERKEAEAKAEKQQAEAKEAERRCYDARARLRELQDGFPIPRTDPNTGARTLLENKDRPAEIASAQKTADDLCNKK